MPLFLKIDPEDSHYWENHPTYEKARRNQDVGLDIPMQKSVIIPASSKSFKINLNIKTNPKNVENSKTMNVTKIEIAKNL